MQSERGRVASFVGNEASVNLLRAAYSNARVSHSYAFSGPPHIGKTTLALWFAQLLLCINPSSDPPEPCGECMACRKVQHGTHPDVQVYDLERQDRDSNRGTPSRELGIDAVRQIVSDIGLLPFEADRKMYIVGDAERLTDEATNSLLKTLEEPPAYAVLILLVTDAASLPDTVRSRVTVVRLSPASTEQVLSCLQSQPGVSNGMATRVASLAAGRPGWAINALSKPAIVEKHDANIQTLLEVLSRGADKRIQLAEHLNKRWASGNRDELYDCLFDWLGFWRELLLHSPDSSDTTPNSDPSVLLDKLPSMDITTLASCAQSTLDTISMIDQNVNVRMALENLLLGYPRT